MSTGFIPTPTINIPINSIDKQANFLLGYYVNDDDLPVESRWKARGFYANKTYITIEEEEIRGEKKLISGEIRVRYKKRRKIELQIPFFESFNKVTYTKGYCQQFKQICEYDNPPIGDFCYYRMGDSKCHGIKVTIPNTENFGSYQEFETILNAPALAYQPLGDVFDNYYNGIDIPESNITRWIRVNLKEKGIEFLDGLKDKKIINLTLMEYKNWYV
jgi:hypothetical protein